MAVISRFVEINLPAEKVFSFVADSNNLSRWFESVAAVENIGGGESLWHLRGADGDLQKVGSSDFDLNASSAAGASSGVEFVSHVYESPVHAAWRTARTVEPLIFSVHARETRSGTTLLECRIEDETANGLSSLAKRFLLSNDEASAGGKLENLLESGKREIENQIFNQATDGETNYVGASSSDTGFNQTRLPEANKNTSRDSSSFAASGQVSPYVNAKDLDRLSHSSHSPSASVRRPSDVNINASVSPVLGQSSSEGRTRDEVLREYEAARQEQVARLRQLEHRESGGTGARRESGSLHTNAYASPQTDTSLQANSSQSVSGGFASALALGGGAASAALGRNETLSHNKMSPNDAAPPAVTPAVQQTTQSHSESVSYNEIVAPMTLPGQARDIANIHQQTDNIDQQDEEMTFDPHAVSEADANAIPIASSEFADDPDKTFVSAAAARGEFQTSDKSNAAQTFYARPDSNSFSSNELPITETRITETSGAQFDDAAAAKPSRGLTGMRESRFSSTMSVAPRSDDERVTRVINAPESGAPRASSVPLIAGLGVLAAVLTLGSLWYARSNDSAAPPAQTSQVAATTGDIDNNTTVATTLPTPVNGATTNPSRTSSSTNGNTNPTRPGQVALPAASGDARNGIGDAELRTSFDNWLVTDSAGDGETKSDLYAPQLERYYRKYNASPEEVEAEKQRRGRRGKLTDVQISEPEVKLARDGKTATMTFRKDYNLERGNRSTRGAVQQELKWRKTADGWRIVSERNLRVLQ